MFKKQRITSDGKVGIGIVNPGNIEIKRNSGGAYIDFARSKTTQYSSKNTRRI